MTKLHNGHKNKGAKGIRLSPQDQERTRAKIDTPRVIYALQEHLEGRMDLSTTQVSAAKILLDRTLPALTAQELSGDLTSYVARLPEPAKTVELWEQSITAPQKAIDGPKPGKANSH